MSVLGSLNTGVSGMDAQAAALSAISNNVANSQTIGYKETNTSFVDYVTQATATSGWQLRARTDRCWLRAELAELVDEFLRRGGVDANAD